MIYQHNDRRLPELIDTYVTGSYGEDAYSDTLTCESCGRNIDVGETYYDVNGSIFCRDCCDAADEAIADAVREEYTYEF